MYWLATLAESCVTWMLADCSLHLESLLFLDCGGDTAECVVTRRDVSLLFS
jgi:hypothetical protein